MMMKKKMKMMKKMKKMKKMKEEIVEITKGNVITRLFPMNQDQCQTKNTKN
jgi:hypothetical protein